MENANWARMAMAVSTALGLVAVSSSASAQYGNEQYCQMVALAVCSHDAYGNQIEPSFGCIVAEYEDCMNARRTLAVKKDSGKNRLELQLATRPAAAAQVR